MQHPVFWCPNKHSISEIYCEGVTKQVKIMHGSETGRAPRSSYAPVHPNLALPIEQDLRAFLKETLSL